VPSPGFSLVACAILVVVTPGLLNTYSQSQSPDRTVVDVAGESSAEQGSSWDERRHAGQACGCPGCFVGTHTTSVGQKRCKDTGVSSLPISGGPVASNGPVWGVRSAALGDAPSLPPSSRRNPVSVSQPADSERHLSVSVRPPSVLPLV
jgi:hypothetical protein